MMQPASPVPLLRSLLHLAVLSGGEGSTRARIFRQIVTTPGLHQRELARQVELRPGHVEHHLRHLVRGGLVWTIEEGGYVRYFARHDAAPDAPHIGVLDGRLLSVLRQPRPLQIVGVVLRSDAPSLGEIAAATGISAGTLTYHVQKLEAAGIVTRERDGRHWRLRIVDRERVTALLLAHAPPPDLVEGFSSLWDDVGL